MPLEVQEFDTLEVQGPRELSPLEADAVNVVFNAPGYQSIAPSELQLEVVESKAGLKGVLFGEIKLLPTKTTSDYDGNGLITINRSAFPHTDALDIESTRRNTEEFKPGNMHYLSTLIHECAYHWQKKYNLYRNQGPYWNRLQYFNREQLRNLELSSGQHAFAVQILFLIQWQIRYRGRSVDLTSQPSNSKRSVGPVDHYIRIANKFPHTNGQRILEVIEEDETDDGPRSVLRDFGSLKHNLEDGGQPNPTVCAKSGQPAQVDPKSPFYKPRKWSIVDIYEQA